MGPRISIARIFLTLSALGLSACGESKTGRRIGFDSKEIETHRLAGDSEIRVSRAATGPTEPFAILDIEIEIGENGRVLSARVAPDGNRYRADPAPALQAARSWRFRPFEFEGAAVVAVGSVEVAYKGPEAWADRDAQFPPVDGDRLSIVLERTGCFGNCPHYRVEIRGDGTVSFETNDFEPDSTPRLSPIGVLVPGKHVSRISRSEVDSLVEHFRSARFFGLKDRYEASITDNPYYTLTFRAGSRSKTVVDYVGHQVGMPEAVTRLEDEVDRVAGTARWIRGDGGAVETLTAEGFDFSSPAAARMLFWAAGDGDERFAIDLIERVPLDSILTEDNGQSRALGIALVEQSVRFERPAIFAELRRRGWLKRVPKSALGRIFAEWAGGCDPAVATAMVEAGADPASRDAEGKTAMINTVDSFGACSNLASPHRHELASRLKDLGVPVGATDAEGNSALHWVKDPELARMLVASGATIDLRNRAGSTPVFAVGDDRVALTLLALGANPLGRDSERRTLRDIAREYRMPGTLAWLDEHRIP
jgi:ankyrin repeat protein